MISSQDNVEELLSNGLLSLQHLLLRGPTLPIENRVLSLERPTACRAAKTIRLVW